VITVPFGVSVTIVSTGALSICRLMTLWACAPAAPNASAQPNAAERKTLMTTSALWFDTGPTRRVPLGSSESLDVLAAGTGRRRGSSAFDARPRAPERFLIQLNLKPL
jgi:hypothetical protein